MGGRTTTSVSYDPSNIEQHMGMTYSTTRGSDYRIDRMGCFHGRDSLEWIKPELVAGLAKSYLKQAKRCLEKKDREKLKEITMEHGKKPSAGKYLVIVLSEEDAKIKNEVGMISFSPLEGML